MNQRSFTDLSLVNHQRVKRSHAQPANTAAKDASQPPARESRRMKSIDLPNDIGRRHVIAFIAMTAFITVGPQVSAQYGNGGYTVPQTQVPQTQPYAPIGDPYAQPTQNYAQPTQNYAPPAQTYVPPQQQYVPPPVTAPSTSEFPPRQFGPRTPSRQQAFAPGQSIPGSGEAFPPLGTDPVYSPAPNVRVADLIVNGFPARTGRIMFGGAVNSDAGVTGQITIDERNFDISRWPTSFGDLFGGSAFRGAGQTFRIEAAPGSDFDRYTMQFADPNLFGYLPISFSTSGFLYDRRYNDWDENRLGGRVNFGYRITPDLSVSAGVGGQRVKFNPTIGGITELDELIGNSALYSATLGLTHNTVDSPIQASQGHYFEMSMQHTFGDHHYNRLDIEYRKYWLLASRADNSGKQTLSYSNKTGFINGGGAGGAPVFERYFAGGYATMRGFDFREMGPVAEGTADVFVGGNFQFLNTVEYMFPLTADDAFRGVAFVDFGTVESSTKFDSDSFRVAPGVGLRVAIPALGPAPLAFDFAFPVSSATQDQERTFSFYMSLIR